jgi:hypothetical protein
MPKPGKSALGIYQAQNPFGVTMGDAFPIIISSPF